MGMNNKGETMKTINIKKDNKSEVKSFTDIKDVRHLIREELWDMTDASSRCDATIIAEKIWNLNIGDTLKVHNHTISVVV